MSGLKTIEYGLGQAGVKVTPDELDMYQTYTILHPGVGTNSIGAVGTTGASGGIAPITNLDFPRNVQAIIATGSGTAMGGTIVVSGKDQFGGTISETIAVASADPGGTTAGSLIFAQIGTITYTKVASLGTISVGYPIGTAAAVNALFGLPDRIAGTADMKRATWIDNDVAKPLSLETAGGTGIFTLVNRAAVRLEVTGGIAAADSFVITYKTTKDLSSQGYQAGL